jgi:hypothetical protein
MVVSKMQGCIEDKQPYGGVIFTGQLVVLFGGALFHLFLGTEKR